MIFFWLMVGGLIINGIQHLSSPACLFCLERVREGASVGCLTSGPVVRNVFSRWCD